MTVVKYQVHHVLNSSAAFLLIIKDISKKYDTDCVKYKYYYVLQLYVIISLSCRRRNVVLLLIFLHTFPPGFLLALYSRAVLHQLIKGFLNANLLAFRSNSKEEILVCYFRTAKSLNSSLVIVLSFLNSHLSILDFGLPVSFNHLFIRETFPVSPCNCPTTVLCGVFITQPTRECLPALIRVCFRKKTP